MYIVTMCFPSKRSYLEIEKEESRKGNKIDVIIKYSYK